jgi:hypothetical protein
MSAQFTRDQSFPPSCKRCGGVLYQYVDFCPYCGTSRPLDAVALGTRPKAAFRALGPSAAAPPVPSAAELSVAGGAALEPPAEEPGHAPSASFEPALLPFVRPGRETVAKGLLLACFILMIAYGVYLLLGEGRKSDSATDDASTHSSGGSISLSSSGQQNNESIPSADARPQATTPPREVPQFKDVTDSLRVAHASLAANNLFDAKAATNAVLGQDADNDEARALQRDIAAREQRRDSALQIAAQCLTQRAWACAQQQASEALAIDSSSQEAQSLMEHAIVATAWRPLASPGAPAAPAPSAPPALANNAPQSLPHGAKTARLPSSQDWGATATASPPPLPSANPAMLGSANTVAAAATTATGPATAAASAPPSNESSADAEERAILQNGWKQQRAAPANASH